MSESLLSQGVAVVEEGDGNAWARNCFPREEATDRATAVMFAVKHQGSRGQVVPWRG